MELDSQTSIYLAMGIILLAVIVFSIIKGLIKMVFLAIAIISAIGVWIFIQSKGFTLLAFVTSSPAPWMVQTLAWGSAILVLAIFFHCMSWFSQLFSLRPGKPGPCSIITTSLMCVLMMWVSTIAISYYGTISRVSFYHDLALAHRQNQPAPEVPLFTAAKNSIRSAEGLSWLESIDPLESPAQSNLACIVAYGCSLNESEYKLFYQKRLEKSGIPHPGRFLDLFADPGLRKLVQEERFVSLLENDRLNAFLQHRNTADFLQTLEGIL